jgi:hypothetical protein
MKTFEPAPQSLQPIEPSLALLIDRGVLSRALLVETTVFRVEVERAVSRGAVTQGQARTLGQLLGVPAQP